MFPQLTADCLNEIFEYLENNRATLCSCLLVNHLWCEVSIRILWRNICNYNTLISCFSDESKIILHKNKIIISKKNSKPPLFNYIKFIKNLSIYDVDNIIKNMLKNYQSITPQNLDYIKCIAAQEVYKLLMNQIYSLRKLDFYSYPMINIPKTTFTSFLGAKDCLRDLTELKCRSDIYPEFFYQLSQICDNIQFLNIAFTGVISNGLTDLISIQQNLKYLEISQNYRSYENGNSTTIISSLTKLPNTNLVSKLVIIGYHLSLSFISKFTNLQELVLSFYGSIFHDPFNDFSKLQDVTFSQLRILKFNYALPRIEFLIKFLEINGGSLEELTLEYLVGGPSSLNSLNLSIAKFCPNLKIFSTSILDGELKTLEEIFNNCQYLESIKIWCNNLNENELWEVVTKYSPENFFELILCYPLGKIRSELLPEELETIFINWMDRTPLKPLSCVIYDIYVEKFDEIIKVIEKYKKLGIIKKFVIS